MRYGWLRRVAVVSLIVAAFGNSPGAQTVGGGGSGGSGGTVTSVGASLGLATQAGTCASGTITSTGVLSACLGTNPQTTSYTLLNSDGSKVVTMNGNSLTLTIGQATASGNFANGWATTILNRGSNANALPAVTIANSGSSTLNGCPAVFAIAVGASLSLASDGTNYDCALNPGAPTWRAVSGTTDTLVPGDCGNGVNYTSASAVTVTLPNNFVPMCSIALTQAGAGKVSPTAAAGGSILTNPHSFTGTFGQNAVIGVTVITNGGTTAAWDLTGDGG